MSDQNRSTVLTEAKHQLALNRRAFIQTTASFVLATEVLAPTTALASPSLNEPAETTAKLLYASLSEKQKGVVCFDWNHEELNRGLLRTHISNNWRITPPAIKSDFFTNEQQVLIRQTFEQMVNPDWIERFDKQFMDDLGGFGKAQSIALFGKPEDKFEFVLTGRHGTMRCDGNTSEHLAFGGPIVYGHAASGYFEKSNHPDNVFWHQAVAANRLYQMLDGKQQKQALQPAAPDEASIGFRGPEKLPGIAVADLSADQQNHLREVLLKLVEPYRQCDREEVLAALKAQGDLAKCSLVFYQEDDLGEDGMWDNWRLEGPAFVWHYRGAPHVHVWVNVSDDPTVNLNAKNLSGALRQK